MTKISMYQQVQETDQFGILPRSDVGDYEKGLQWQLRKGTELIGTFETPEAAAKNANQLFDLPEKLSGWIEKPVVEFKWG